MTLRYTQAGKDPLLTSLQTLLTQSSAGCLGGSSAIVIHLIRGRRQPVMSDLPSL